jgi:hypothetical protein
VCYEDTNKASQTRYYTAYHTITTNAQCADVTDCWSETYMLEGPSATTNRQCASRITCKAGNEYISNAGADGYGVVNSVVDSTCAALTVCDSAKYEVAVTDPTPTSDRECGASKATSPTAAPTPASTKAPFGTVEGSIVLTGLVTAFDIKAGAWKTAIADVLGVSEESVRNVEVANQGSETKATATLRSRFLGTYGVVVKYQVAVNDDTELAAVQKSMNDFADGGVKSLTKLKDALENVSPGAKNKMGSAVMVAKTVKAVCETCSVSGSDSGLAASEIAGIAVGGLVGAAFVFALVKFCICGNGSKRVKPGKSVAFGNTEHVLNMN